MLSTQSSKNLQKGLHSVWKYTINTLQYIARWTFEYFEPLFSLFINSQINIKRIFKWKMWKNNEINDISFHWLDGVFVQNI